MGCRAGSEKAHGAVWGGRESGSCYLEWRQLNVEDELNMSNTDSVKTDQESKVLWGQTGVEWRQEGCWWDR